MHTPDVSPALRPLLDTSRLEVSRDGAAPADAPPSPVPAEDEDLLEGLFTDDILHALVHALPSGDTDTAEEKYQRKAAAIHLLRSFDAQQPVEAALATQAVLAHHAALAAFRRAAQPAQFSDITSRETGSAARMSTQFRFLLRELDQRQDHPAQPPKAEHRR